MPAPRLVHDALRAFHWRLTAARYRLMRESARLRRRFLRRTVFIGVTGSAGKTTVKELIVQLLSSEGRARGSHLTENRPEQVARLLWQTSPADDYCVAELSATRPGMIGQSLAVVRPHVGVVTTIRSDHIAAFGSPEAIAAEKGLLVSSLPEDGVAVLNADDERVAAMRTRCKGRALTYGLSEGADVRGEEVSSVWPERLSLRVAYGDARVEVRTQLCGEHWAHSVLAALASALSLGMPLAKCARTLAATSPFVARMQPVTTADGVTFIRDDWKAPLWTVDSAFAFMRQARAPRKVVVVGTLSDYGGDASAQYARVARLALEVADHVVFVGPWASRALRAADGNQRGTLRAFSSVQRASDYLNQLLRSGDLVLLKGTNRKDHLIRLILTRSGEVQCWKDDCGRHIFCDDCSLLSVPAAAPGASVPRSPEPLGAPAPEGRDLQVVIGLGNPGRQYAGTPHNVGHDVLECLARTLDAQWTKGREADMATLIWKGRELCLIKLQAGVNKSGPAIMKLSEHLGFSAGDCVLVHDDLDLPLGTVRARLRGSAGGHRGVASVLEAFQTDLVRRVKVGIGRPDSKRSVVDYVLQPFPQAERPLVDQACRAATDRVLAVLAEAA